jgi:glutamate N-acetyltransferase/amino-acid N-acetyltransferase
MENTMFPKDFVVGGLHCGVAKKKEKKDLALFYSRRPAVAAAMFTGNLVKAAPVLVSARHLDADRPVRAIVANSGCANACTGTPGLNDAEQMCRYVAGAAGIAAGEVLVGSTGVIGRRLPMAKVQRGIRTLWSDIAAGHHDPAAATAAIMTTDTVPKTAQRTITAGGRTINIWGCVKGSGMIHPDLKPHATMLCFILTDAVIGRSELAAALRHAVDESFNCVTVDSDTSTNDTVAVLANGAAENARLKKGTAACAQFARALDAVCLDLAKMIAADGEGATHAIEIAVRGAADDRAAKKIAATIATSPLVKTAIFGKDANWGRVIAAAGRAGVPIDPAKVEIFLGDVRVARRGMDAGFSEARVRKVLERREIAITVDLHMGRGRATYYTCDYSFDYIKINANYRT